MLFYCLAVTYALFAPRHNGVLLRARTRTICIPGYIALTITFIGSFIELKGLPQVTIVWSTGTNSNSPNLLTDANETLLSSGAQGNGDGDLVELGYFTPQGDWMPLTHNTHIGDSSSGYGFPDGMFTFTTNFTKGSSSAITFPTENKEFSEKLDFEINDTTPGTGTQIWIRFYDSHYKQGANYNTVTGSDWTWPNFPSGSSPPNNLYFKIASGSSPLGSSWKYGSTFEDSNISNNFKTSIVPKYTINFAKSSQFYGNGTVIPDVNSSEYKWGEQIIIRATPADHSYFIKWTGSGITNQWEENSTLTVDGDQTVFAEFDKKPYFLDLYSKGLGKVTGSGLFTFGDYTTISAEPDPGYTFDHWQWSGAGVDWVWNNWGEDPSKIGTLVYDLNDSTHLSDLNISLQTGLYSVIQIESKNYLKSVEFVDSNKSWVPDDGGSFGTNKNQLELKQWLDDKGFAPLNKNDSIDVTLLGDTSLNAVFTPNEYEAVVDYDSTRGEVEIFDTNGSKLVPSKIENAKPIYNFRHGNTYTIRSDPKDHYMFNNWSGPSSTVAMLTNKGFAETTFISTGDMNLTANLSEFQYQLTIQSTQGYNKHYTNPLPGNHNYPAFETVEVKVVPLEGFQFDYWQDPMGILSNPNLAITDANISKIGNNGAVITSILNLIGYDENNITIVADIGGRISELGRDQSGKYIHFNSYTISAEPEPGYIFDHWEGDGNTTRLAYGAKSADNELLIEGPFPIQLSAKFKLKDYRIISDSVGDGWVNGLPETFTINDNLLMNAFAHPGSKFSHWEGNIEFLTDAITENSNSIKQWTVNTPPQDISLTAVFIPRILEINLNKLGEGSISYYTTNQSGSIFDSKSITLPSNEKITLETNPPTIGWTFSHWEGLPTYNELFYPDSFVEPTASVVWFHPPEDLNITAHHKLEEYDRSVIDINTSEGGNYQFDEIENYKHFSWYELNATAQNGYVFEKWVVDKKESLKEGISEKTNKLLIEGPIAAKAIFKIVEFDLELNQSQGPSLFTIHDRPRVVATEKVGWDFTHWTGDIEFLEDETKSSTYVIPGTKPKNLSLTANFVREEYQFTIGVEGNGSLNIFKDGDVFLTNETLQVVKIDSATRLSITALPLSGWTFSKWIGLPRLTDLEDPDAKISPSDSEVNFVPTLETNNSQLIAQFERASFFLEMPLSSGGFGMGSKTYDFEDVAEISATPDDHYLFDRWSGDISHITYDLKKSTNEVKIPDTNISITPLFKPKTYNINVSSGDDGNFVVNGTYDDITYSNQIDFNATSQITIKAVPHDLDAHMLSYMEWNNSLGKSGKIFYSEHNIGFLDANYSFRAIFTNREDIDYTLVAEPSRNSGEVSRDSSLSTDKHDRLVAKSEPGFSFIGWSSSSEVKFDPNWRRKEVYSKPPSNSQVFGHFSAKSFSLSVDCNSSRGTVSELPSTFEYGADISCSANPLLSEEGKYEFVNWELLKNINMTVSEGKSSVNPRETRVYINGQESPELTLVRGFTYHFACDLDPNVEFFISSEDNTTSEFDYTLGVTGNRISNGILSFVVPEDAPDSLFYNFSNKLNSGNFIEVISKTDEDIIPSPENEHFEHKNLKFEFGLKAHFEPAKQEFNITETGGGKVTYLEQEFYRWGDKVEITIESNPHWYFSHWEGVGVENLENQHNQNSTSLDILQKTNLTAVFKKIPYDLHVLLYDEENNILSEDNEFGSYRFTDNNSGPFVHGELVSLTAIPLSSTGKQFSGWENLTNLELVENNEPSQLTASFKVLGNAEVSAKFSKVSYEIFQKPTISLNENDQVIKDDNGGGISITKNQNTNLGEIYFNDWITFKWENKMGYEFLRWEDGNGKLESNGMEYSIHIQGNTTIQAVVRKKLYDLTTEVKGAGSVTTEGTSPYYWDENVSISATPDAHWYFVKWTGSGTDNLTSIESEKSILTIKESSTITAQFKLNDYNIKFNDKPSGFAKEFKTQPTKDLHNFGDEVEITATPRPGKHFKSWTIEANATFADENGKNQQTTKLIIQGNARIRANFASNEYTATTEVIIDAEDPDQDSSESGGRILGGTNQELGLPLFFDEEIAEFIISPSNKFMFDHWKIEESTGVQITSFSNPTLKHKMLGNTHITAVMTQRKFNVNLKLNPVDAEYGYVVLNNKNKSAENNSSYIYGESLDIKAVPFDDYRFVQWESIGTILKDPTLPNQNILVSNDLKLSAFFAPKGEINLKIEMYPEGAGIINSTVGILDYNLNHPIAIQSKNGYEFDYWAHKGTKATGIVSDPESPISTIRLDGNRTIIAVFKGDESSSDNSLYLLNITPNNPNHGSTSKSGFFRGWKTINAYPAEEFEFSHWEGGTFENQFEKTTRIQVTQNSNIIAYFQSVGVFDDTESFKNGWWGNEWFGFFWKVGAGDWIFHEHLGWIFMKKNNSQSIWIWIQKLEGWYWTAKQIYPYLYLSDSLDSPHWIWVNKDKSNYSNLIYYQFKEGNEEWVLE